MILNLIKKTFKMNRRGTEDAEERGRKYRGCNKTPPSSLCVLCVSVVPKNPPVLLPGET